MGRLIVIFGLLASLCGSCCPPCRDTNLYQHSGRQKAIVAVLPVLDNTKQSYLSWDLSREFTDEIRKRVYTSSKVYLLRDHGSREIAERLSVPNPKMIPNVDLDTLGATEFVVVSELIDQKATPLSSRQAFDYHLEGGSLLQLTMRLRVIDIRHGEPKVILQEIVNTEHPVSLAFLNSEENLAPWGTEGFDRTSLGMAHHQFVREIVARVENYIEAAR